MSRITKSIAENVAIKLTEKQTKEIQSLKNDLSQKLTEFYLKRVPKQVLDLFKKYPNYMQTIRYLQLKGNGFDWKDLNLSKEVPYTNHVFEPNEEEGKILIKLSNSIDNKKSDLQKLKLEIETLVFGLRTYAKVKSEFPEAIPFLPENTSTALMVNISDLRKKLK